MLCNTHRQTHTHTRTCLYVFKGIILHPVESASTGGSWALLTQKIPSSLQRHVSSEIANVIKWEVPKIGYPKLSSKSWMTILVLKTMVLAYPHFRKPPNAPTDTLVARQTRVWRTWWRANRRNFKVRWPGHRTKV